jgi:hypothetical protein
MFASWSKTRRGTAVAASIAAVGAFAMAAPSAHALEGIQGRTAIFIPSLELVYQHDDNFFLTKNNTVSAESFIAHAHFALEVPGARQYLRFEYAPQWRDVNVSKGADPDIDNVTHFWDLKARLKGSSVFGVDINHQFTSGILETYDIDPNRELVNRASDRWQRNNLDVDFKWTGSRQTGIVSVGKEDTSFQDNGPVTPWFELDAWRLGTEYRWKFAPLTNFVVNYKHEEANQDYTVAYNNATGALTSVDSSSDNLGFGFDGELGRTTTGRAVVGFKSLNFDDNQGFDDDFSGITLRADVTKSFSRWTKLIFNAERTANYSGYGAADRNGQINAFYVSNRASFTLSNQPQGAKVGWTLIGQFQRNGYDTPTDDGNGVFKEREDDVSRVRAEIGFHPLEHLSFRLNYQWEERESNINEFDYTDNIVAIQLQFGF